MRIILNADDFGYSTDTVEATIECFERGLLTSATIMPTGRAADEALAYARGRADLSFGVHLTFVGEGDECCAAPREHVQSLVDHRGRFGSTRDLRVRALLRLIPVAQIAEEITAQLAVVADAGVPVSHVDSHRHLHKFASFQAALRRALPEHGIRRVRTVQDVYLQRPITNVTYWAGRYWRKRLARAFDTTDHFYMPTTAHDADWHRVAGRLESFDGDLIEVGLHPGSAEPWRRREQESLQAFVDAARERDHELVTWHAVGG